MFDFDVVTGPSGPAKRPLAVPGAPGSLPEKPEASRPTAERPRKDGRASDPAPPGMP
jgi:hypothetical protein